MAADLGQAVRIDEIGAICEEHNLIESDMQIKNNKLKDVGWDEPV